MDDCHSQLRRMLSEAGLVQDLYCRVERAEYRHPKTALFRDEPATRDLVRRSFLGLHPEFDSTRGFPRAPSEVRTRPSYDSYRFQHGDRIFGVLAPGCSRPDPSPVFDALDQLGKPSSRAYIPLATTPAPSAQPQPMPALTSLQFVRSGDRLDIMASFRKIELAFWWVVNLMELVELLKWAAESRNWKPGAIGLFAALAEWRPSNPEHTVVPKLQTRSLMGLTTLAFRVAKHDSRGEFAALLDDFIAHTHANNFSGRVLGQFVELLHGAHTALDQAPDPELLDNLVRAHELLVRAVSESNEVERSATVSEAKRALELASSRLQM